MLTLAFRLYERLKELNPRIARRNRAYYAESSQHPGLPVPPPHLIMQVAGTPDIATFLEGGHLASQSIREILEAHHVNLSEATLLDFGCGCGRVLRCWHDLPAAQIHGTDYNPALVEWAAANLPFARLAQNQLMPPTTYAGGTFDLIYALSVFTHLPEAAQLAWIAEFGRILRPGGHLLLSLHGECYLPRLTTQERREFEAGRLVVRFQSSAGTNLCSTFHPSAYVHQTIAQGFRVVAHVPEGAKGNPRQDAWLFEKSAT